MDALAPEKSGSTRSQRHRVTGPRICHASAMTAAAPERPPLTREAIVTAARDMVRTGGIEALSLRRLATRLGVTAPALYAHVSSKRDLVRAVAEVEFDRLLERFSQIDTTDPLERIRAQSRAYIDHARENPELFQVMFVFPPDLGASPLPDGVELPAATGAFTTALAAVEQAMDAGRIERADPMLVALTLWTANHGLAMALLLGLSLPPELENDLVDEVTSRLLHGWAPQA